MQLHSFFNSSTSYRVRIALALKGLPVDITPVNLRKQEQRAADYVARNPSAGVPLLTDGDFQLSQSLAIIDYLDATHPEPRLIPAAPRERARVLELSNAIACDIHPVNNMRILRYLQEELGATDAQKNAWYHHWIDPCRRGRPWPGRGPAGWPGPPAGRWPARHGGTGEGKCA